MTDTCKTPEQVENCRKLLKVLLTYKQTRGALHREHDNSFCFLGACLDQVDHEAWKPSPYNRHRKDKTRNYCNWSSKKEEEGTLSSEVLERNYGISFEESKLLERMNDRNRMTLLQIGKLLLIAANEDTEFTTVYEAYNHG